MEAVTSGFLFTRGTAFWVLKAQERLSRLQENNPQGTAEKSWKTLPFGITLPPSAGMLQKLGVRGREGSRGLKKFPGRGECAAPARADPPPRTHRPRPRSCGRRRARSRPAAPRGPRRAGTPADVPLGTRLRIVPVTTYPVFLAPGGHCKPLFIPSYRIHGGFSSGVSQCSASATSKRSSDPEGSPPP